MATSERLAAEINAGTGLDGHDKKLSGMVLGKQRLFANGSRNLPITSWADDMACLPTRFCMMMAVGDRPLIAMIWHQSRTPQ